MKAGQDRNVCIRDVWSAADSLSYILGIRENKCFLEENQLPVCQLFLEKLVFI
jgi:hypothetical protein